mgnify:CR=1 FL=1
MVTPDDVGARIGGVDDATDSGRNDCIRAGRCFAVVAAGFECYVESCAARVFAGFCECGDFGVRTAVHFVKACADDLLILYDHCADERIRLNAAPAALGHVERVLHECGIRGITGQSAMRTAKPPKNPPFVRASVPMAEVADLLPPSCTPISPTTLTMMKVHEAFAK